MGVWGNAPWDNDIGADWFSAFFGRMKANARIRKAFKDRNDLPVIRAACWILGTLGRVYVWPDDLDELKGLLDQGIALMTRIAKPTQEDINDGDFAEYWDDDPEFLRAVRAEIAVLKKRRSDFAS